MPTAEALMCQCGGQLKPFDSGKGLYCENCDRPQQQEGGPRPRARRRTLQDVRYDLWWKGEIDNYEDNRSDDDKKKDPNPSMSLPGSDERNTDG